MKNIIILLIFIIFSFHIYADDFDSINPAKRISELNSDSFDFEVTYSSDGKTAIFASNRLGGYGGNDIYFSYFKNGHWSKPENAGSAINSVHDDQEPSFSQDGKLIYFTRYDSQLNGDLYVSQIVNGVWQPAQSWNNVAELPSLNRPDSEEHCPIIVNKDLIYYSYDKPDVTQASDIWQVKRINGIWQNPEPLPGNINSKGPDHLHWTGLSKDGNSLIVVSDRQDQGSQGNGDEFISYKDKNGHWSTPISIGKPLNTKDDEMCWAFTPDGKYFTGTRGKGMQGSNHHTNAELLKTYNFVAIKKEDIPLLKDFESIGLPINIIENNDQ